MVSMCHGVMFPAALEASLRCVLEPFRCCPFVEGEELPLVAQTRVGVGVEVHHAWLFTQRRYVREADVGFRRNHRHGILGAVANCKDGKGGPSNLAASSLSP